MEQAREWMWAKRKHCLRTCGDYWEEQAAEDSSGGSVGGCIWPPRSYSCSFCRREFRSAQALGGHMNVHRRDKARLNQPPTPPQTEILPHQIISIPPSPSLYGPNTNTNTNTNAAVIIAPSLSPSRVSTPSSTQGNYCEQTNYNWVSPSYSSIILHDQHHQQHTKESLFSSSPSWSEAVRVVKVSDSKKIEGEKNWRVEEDVGMDWNLVVPGNQPAGSGGGDEEEEGLISKRRRSDDISSQLPYFLNSISVDNRHLQSEVLGIFMNPKEDLDLELRLGDGPKLK